MINHAAKHFGSRQYKSLNGLSEFRESLECSAKRRSYDSLTHTVTPPSLSLSLSLFRVRATRNVRANEIDPVFAASLRCGGFRPCTALSRGDDLGWLMRVRHTQCITARFRLVVTRHLSVVDQHTTRPTGRHIMPAVCSQSKIDDDKKKVT